MVDAMSVVLMLALVAVVAFSAGVIVGAVVGGRSGRDHYEESEP